MNQFHLSKNGSSSILLLLIALFLSGNANGQAELVTKDGSKYFYKNKQYGCEELGNIYQDHQEALDLYLKGRSKLKAARVTRYIGLGFIVVGFGVGSEGSLNQAAIGGLIFTTGLLLELVSLIPQVSSKNSLKKALHMYNHEMIKRHGYKTEESLSFGVTRNGIGFIYGF